MGTIGTVVVVVGAVALAVAAVLQLRGGPLPFPAIITGAVTCSLCYIVAGASQNDSDLPSVPTVVGSAVGVMTIGAMIISLVPRSPDRDDNRRSPIWLAASGTLLGSVGLLAHTFL